MSTFYKERVVYQALERLDEELFEMKVAPFELNVIGGFALILEGIRVRSDYTDIDYIGSRLPDKIREKIDEIGAEYGLGRGWINNDVLLSGSSLEEIQYCTGKLRFTHKFDLRVITINSLDLRDLLKMKVIAIDTSYMGIELGGEFTRTKDFKDIQDIMEMLGFNMKDLVALTREWVLCPEIYRFISYFNKTNDYDFMVNGKYKELLIKT